MSFRLLSQNVILVRFRLGTERNPLPFPFCLILRKNSQQTLLVTVPTSRYCNIFCFRLNIIVFHLMKSPFLSFFHRTIIILVLLLFSFTRHVCLYTFPRIQGYSFHLLVISFSYHLHDLWKNDRTLTYVLRFLCMFIV